MHHRVDPFLELDYGEQILDEIEIPHEFFIPAVHVLLPLLRGAVLSDGPTPHSDRGVKFEGHLITCVINILLATIFMGALISLLLMFRFVAELIDLSEDIVLERMRDVIGVRKVEPLGHLDVLEGLNELSLLLSVVWSASRYGR